MKGIGTIPVEAQENTGKSIIRMPAVKQDLPRIQPVFITGKGGNFASMRQGAGKAGRAYATPWKKR
jgi:hypothetical protein